MKNKLYLSLLAVVYMCACEAHPFVYTPGGQTASLGVSWLNKSTSSVRSITMKDGTKLYENTTGADNEGYLNYLTNKAMYGNLNNVIGNGTVLRATGN